MAQHDITDRTLALAGLFQAAAQVQDMATRGKTDPDAFATSIRSIFELNPRTTEAIFGGVAGVRIGLQTLLEHLSGEQTPHKAQIVKYAIGVLYLERQLVKQPELLDKIRVDIERARSQSEHFSITHSNVLASLAGCYSETISTLTPRIIVSGEQGHLSNPEVANAVRALLLAAIRSAILWRQCGGNRIQLLFGRRKLLAEAQRLLESSG
jgi:high frequency lysogenization protein